MEFATLEVLVADLGVRFAAGPCLIHRLEDPASRTTQPRETVVGTRRPGSRPPAPLDALHWAGVIKTQVVLLDMDLRDSPYAQDWPRALRALPHNAEAAGRRPATHSAVAALHSAALTCLGLQMPAPAVRGVRCLVCGQESIRIRADEDRPRAWCGNDDCWEQVTDSRGELVWRRTRYSGQRLYDLAGAAGSATAPAAM